MAEKKYLDYDGLALYDSTLKSDATPAANGTAAAGTSKKVSRADHVHPTDTSRAPTSHASSATTYGKGTSSNYGHVKLSDATNGTTAAASGGTAATPKAVADALTAAKAYADSKADQNTTYTLSGSLSSHKVTSTLTPSSGDATTSDFTLAAGTGISLTDNTSTRTITIATTGEANQNAFSNVKVGSTTIAADAKQDTLELVAGSNVTLTPDATNDKVTIASTDTNTTYTLGTTGSGSNRKVTLTPSNGTTQSIDVPDTTYSNFTGSTSSKVGTRGLVPAPPIPTTPYTPDTFSLRADGQFKATDFIFQKVTSGTDLVMHVDVVDKNGNASGFGNYTIPAASTTANGVMSSDDKTKLNGIEAGAETNQNAFSHIKVSDTNVDADSATDTVEFVAGTDITITPDATNDKVTFAAVINMNNATNTLKTYNGGTGAAIAGTGLIYKSTSGNTAMSVASAANIVSEIGNTAVARATADASGNNIADTYAKKSDIASMYKYKGSVATESALPSTGVTTGDVYNIEAESSYGPAGSNVAWTGEAWDSLGGLFTITSITNAEINALFA